MYLKPNVVLEPLICNWYAWAHLLSPATAALNVLNKHVPVMNSYLRSKELHDAAASDEKMTGGMFFNYDVDRTEEIKSLIGKTEIEQKKLLDLARAIVDVRELLIEQDGASLEGLYPLVPDALKGYVELIYDNFNRADFRLFEALLFNSDYRTDNHQQIRLFTIDDDLDRGFILSSPRVAPDNLVSQIPFSDGCLDELARATNSPVDPVELSSKLNFNEEQKAEFLSLFTDQSPTTSYEAPTSELRIRYFGHACVLIETPDCSILTDPAFSYQYETDVERYTLADLPDVIDYVLLTHNHQDHVLCEALLRIRHKVKNVVVPRDSNGTLQDPSLRLILQSLNFSNVITLGDLESIQAGSVTITGIPFIGEHGDLDVRSKLCFHVDSVVKSFLFAVDTRTVEPALYKHVRAIVGDIDVIFLGMECEGAPLSYLYGPLMGEKLNRKDDRERTLNGSGFDQAKSLVECFDAGEVYIYALGQEPWLNYIMNIEYSKKSSAIVHSNQLIEYCTQMNIKSERLYLEREWNY